MKKKSSEEHKVEAAPVNAQNEKESSNKPLYIIGIGASAGGLEALQEFLSHYPAEIKNTAIIIAQHLSPTHKSMLVQLLSHKTALVVSEAVDGHEVETNKVYITPPAKEISYQKGRIFLCKPQFPSGPKPSVDVLFESLANELKERAIGVILSGTGSDGAMGVKAIKKNGGLILVQEPQTAKYDGMPMAAITACEADAVLSPDKMGEEIKDILLYPNQVKIKLVEESAAMLSLDKIFKILSKKTGTDFSNYKPSTICRRLEKRLGALKLNSIDEYLPILQNNPNEVDEMFNLILIGVTTFFRDKEAFEHLKELLVQIVSKKKPNDPIRIWSTGCSTGEEPYSIAILLSEILREKIDFYRIQIFATDIDENAIRKARKASYPASSVDEVPKEILDRYFLKKGKDFELIKSIRSMVLFSKHDLTNNPPFLKLDLISCRNLLIYFGAKLQQQIIPIFHYALVTDGFLFLGKSETVGQYGDLFATVDGKSKIFQRKRGGNINAVKFSAFKTTVKNSLPISIRKPTNELSLSDIVKETLFNSYEYPYVVIDANYDIHEVSGDVRPFLGLAAGSIQVNLLKMVNRELQIELRSIVSTCINKRVALKSDIKKFDLFDQSYYVRLTAKPLIYTESHDEFFIVIFEQLDLDEFVKKGVVLQKNEVVDDRIQELEHELTTTKEHLQTYIEEIETSNEELQSLNEEMQSTNEELQSTNEELETTNEELQSTNEEIQITYAELKAANEELEITERLLVKNEANLSAMLNNTLQSFILIDTDYKILNYNNKSIELSQEFFSKKINVNDSYVDLLDSSLLESFINDFKIVLSGQSLNREFYLGSQEGKKHSFMVNYSPVFAADGSVKHVSLGMIDISALKNALYDLNMVEGMLFSIFNATIAGIYIIDEKGVIIDCNEQFCKIFGYRKQELQYQHFSLIVPDFLITQEIEEHLQLMEDGKSKPKELKLVRKNGNFIDIQAFPVLLSLPDGKRLSVVSIIDISDFKRQKDLLEASHVLGKTGGWELDLKSEKLFCSETLHKLFEVNNADEVSLKSFKDFLVEKDAEIFDQKIKEVSKTGESLDLLLQTKNLTVKWLKVIGKAIVSNNEPIRIIGSFQDVSEQIRLNALLEDAYQLARIGGWELDLVKGKLTWSKMTKQIHEVAPDFEPELETAINYYKEGRDRDLINQCVKKAIEEGIGWEEELVLITATGKEIWVKAIGQPIFEEGKCVRLLGSFQDIDARKRTELELNKQQQQYKSLFEQNPDAVFSMDLDGKINTTNNELGLLLNTSTNEIIGQSFVPFCLPSEQAKVKAYLKAVLEGKPQRFEVEISTTKNRQYILNVSFIPIIFEDVVQGIYGIAKNITEVVLAQKKVEATKEKYKQLIEHSGDATLILSLEGDVKFAAASVRNILGYTEKEIEKFNFFDLVHIEDISSFKQEIQNGLENNIGVPVVYAAVRMKHKNGSWLWIELTLTNQLQSPLIMGLVCNFRDVTLTKRIQLIEAIERNVLENQAKTDIEFSAAISDYFSRLDAIFPYLIFSIFIETSESLNILAGPRLSTDLLKFFDERNFKELEPKLIETLLNTKFIDVEDKETAKKWPQFTKCMERNKVGHVFSYPLIDKNSATLGTLMVFKKTKTIYSQEEQDCIERVRQLLLLLLENNTVTQNLLENKQLLELSLNEMKAQKQAMDEHSIIAITDVKGTIIYANESFCEISKYSLEELVGQNHRILNSGYHPTAFFVEMYRTIGAGKVWNAEIRNKAKDGSYYWVDTTIVPKIDPQTQKPVQYIAIRTDITNIKNNELILQELNEKLSISNSELEQFAYVASHDLQEPIRMISSFLTLLEKKYGNLLDDKGKQYIQFAVEGSTRVRKIILDLLEYSRVSKKELSYEHFQVKEVLDVVVHNLQVSIQEKNASVKWETMPTIYAAFSPIQALFQNLISNALKYCSPDRTPEILIRYTENTTHWIFEVKDNGIGIDSKYYNLIFVLFQRLHGREQYSGTGIGLSISEKIVKNHKGEIWVESTPDVGSSFFFSILKTEPSKK